MIKTQPLCANSRDELKSGLKSAFQNVTFPFTQADEATRPLVQLLRSIFEEEPFPYSTYEESKYIDYSTGFYNWYLDLSSFSEEAYLYVLPRLLATQLDPEPLGGDYKEELISWLNLPNIAPAFGQIPDDTLQNILPRAQRGVDKLVGTITEEQAKVIYCWLHYVDENYDNLYRSPELQGSLDYWRDVVALKSGK